ncbi:6198_t:CDS:1, partial [Cetraspora pellucida]
KQLTAIKQQQWMIKVYVKAPGQCIKKVIDWAWKSTRDNKTLSAYLKVGNMICQRCYNGIIVCPSAMMEKHANETNNVQYSAEALLKSGEMSFSKAIETITKILYKQKITQKLLAFQKFEEFRAYMEAENI